MKAFVDRDTCIGCKLCVSQYLDVHNMDDEAKAAVLVEPVPEHLKAFPMEAKKACPVNAISVGP